MFYMSLLEPWKERLRDGTALAPAPMPVKGQEEWEVKVIMAYKDNKYGKR